MTISISRTMHLS